MSWSEHVKNLEESKNVTKVAFYNIHQGVFAKSDGFPITKEHFEDILRGFGNSLLFESAPKLPVLDDGKDGKWEEKPCVCYRVSDNSIYIKNINQGYVFCKTKLFILVGYYGKGLFPQQAIPIIEKFRMYLEENNY